MLRFGPQKPKRSGKPNKGYFERGRVRVADVRVGRRHQDAEPEIVRQIQESFEFMGGECFQSIGVRRATEIINGKSINVIELVFGLKRLEAHKRAGLEYIDCVYLTGSDLDRDLIRVGENLLRSQHSVLTVAEWTVQFYNLAEEKLRLSGQLDQKGKLAGRPKGGLSQIARHLDALGGSPEARRNKMKRYMKIAGLCDTAKAVARSAGFDNNQGALLWIAEATTAMAQVARAQTCAERYALAAKKQRPVAASANIATVSEEESKRDAWPKGGGFGTRDGGKLDDGDSDDEDGNENTTIASPSQTTQEELEAFWAGGGKELWSYAPRSVRLKFIQGLQRAKCRAPMDIDEFILDVFSGRRLIDCAVLKAYAVAKGYSWPPIASRLKQWGYKKHRGSRANGPHSYYNADNSSVDNRRVVSDVELEESRKREREDEDEYLKKREPLPTPQAETDFYDGGKTAAEYIQEKIDALDDDWGQGARRDVKQRPASRLTAQAKRQFRPTRYAALEFPEWRAADR